MGIFSRCFHSCHLSPEFLKYIPSFVLSHWGHWYFTWFPLQTQQIFGHLLEGVVVELAISNSVGISGSASFVFVDLAVWNASLILGNFSLFVSISIVVSYSEGRLRIRITAWITSDIEASGSWSFICEDRLTIGLYFSVTEVCFINCTENNDNSSCVNRAVSYML